MAFILRIQILLIALLFTMTSAFLQISPSVNADYVVNKLAIDEDLFLKLTTLYFLSYAILQVPNGYILDTKGFEKIFPISIFLVLVGCLTFWLSNNTFLIGFSRLVIGAGCSTSYIISIFIATKYFNKAILPLLISFAEIATGLGDYFAGNAYLSILEKFGWNITNLIIVLVLFCLFLYSLFLMKILKRARKNGPKQSTHTLSKMLTSIKRMLKSPVNVAIFAYSFFTWGIIMTFAGYWAKNYYINMHNYTTEYALFLPEIYWLSFLVAALIVGFYVKTISQAKKYILALSMLGTIAYLIMTTPILFGYSLLISLTIISGISAAGVVLSFFIIQNLVTDEEKGLAISLNNFFIVLGGMFGQVIFSIVITFNSSKLFTLTASVNSYFYSGIIMLALWSMLSLLALIFIIRKI